jgi:hypothetical protein
MIVNVFTTSVLNSKRQSLSGSGFKQKIVLVEASRRLQGHTPRVILGFETKPNTHRICAHDHLFHTHGQKVFAECQMS